MKQIVDSGCYDIVYKKQTKSSTTITMPNKTTISDESKNRYMLIEVLVAIPFNLYFAVLLVWFVNWIKKNKKCKNSMCIEI